MRLFNRKKPSSNTEKLATKTDIESLRQELHPRVSEREIMDSLTSKQRDKLRRIRDYNRGKR